MSSRSKLASALEKQGLQARLAKLPTGVQWVIHHEKTDAFLGGCLNDDGIKFDTGVDLPERLFDTYPEWAQKVLEYFFDTLPSPSLLTLKEATNG